jgi:hypothetical protein
MAQPSPGAGYDPSFLSVFVGSLGSEEQSNAYLDVEAGQFYQDIGLSGSEHEAVEWSFDPDLWRQGQAAFEGGFAEEVNAADAFKDATRLKVGRFDAVLVVIGHDYGKRAAPGTRLGRVLFVGAYDVGACELGGDGPEEF